MHRDLLEIAAALRAADRTGSGTEDVPEGTLTIQLSHTLAIRWAEIIERAVGRK